MSSLEEQLTDDVEAPAETVSPRPRFQTFSSLRHLDFRYLCAGTFMMSAGQWIQQVTLGWLVYELTGNSVLLGALNGLRALPFLVTGPMAGVAADRMDRQKLMLRTQYLLIATAIVMGGLVVSGWLQVWHIFVFTLITGIGWTFSEPVRQSLIPSVVPKAELANAIALNSGGFNLMKIIGPALGGVMIALFGAGGNFFVQSAAYVGVLVMIYLMHVPPTPETGAPLFRNGQSQAGLRLCMVHPGRSGADGFGLCPAYLCGALPDLDAGLSKGCTEGGS